MKDGSQLCGGDVCLGLYRYYKEEFRKEVDLVCYEYNTDDELYGDHEVPKATSIPKTNERRRERQDLEGNEPEVKRVRLWD